jgi:hypothetical protein
MYERLMRIWDELVRYANADFSRRTKQDIENLRKLLVDCMWSVDWESDFNLFDQDVDSADTLADLAELYQPGIRMALYWLATHNNQTANEAVRFLDYHARQAQRERWPNSSFDETSRHGYPILMFDGVVAYGTMIAPVCRFILDCADKHDDNAEQPVTDLIPIGICAREGCGKFIVIRRVGRKKFCLDCKSHPSRMITRQRGEYMRHYRQRLEELQQKPIRFPKPLLPVARTR